MANVTRQLEHCPGCHTVFPAASFSMLETWPGQPGGGSVSKELSGRQKCHFWVYLVQMVWSLQTRQESAVIKNRGFEANKIWAESQLSHSLAAWTWASCPSSPEAQFPHL